METWLDQIRPFLQHASLPAVAFVVATAALLQHVVPAPTDLVVLLCAFLAAKYRWPALPLYGAALLGSGIGGIGDFYVGRWLVGRPGERLLGRFWASRSDLSHARVEKLLVAFRQHGEVYVLINRFVPPVRSLFLVVAGMAGLRPGRVVLFLLISAAVWHGLLFAIGMTVGSNWDQVLLAFRDFSLLVWAVPAFLVVFFVTRALLRRRAIRR